MPSFVTRLERGNMRGSDDFRDATMIAHNAPLV
jgi:hypothetical protein